MPRNVKVTAISLPKGLVAEIATRMANLRMRSRSDYFAKLAEADVRKGGPLVIPADQASAPEGAEIPAPKKSGRSKQ